MISGIRLSPDSHSPPRTRASASAISRLCSGLRSTSLTPTSAARSTTDCTARPLINRIGTEGRRARILPRELRPHQIGHHLVRDYRLEALRLGAKSLQRRLLDTNPTGS